MVVALSIKIFDFIKQVRAEALKVVWPSRKETFVSTLSVFVMVFFVGVFLFIVDWLSQMGVWGVLDFFEHLFS